MAAWNEEDVILRKLENLRSLDYPQERVQVIVAADGSNDATVEFAQSVEGTIVLHRAERTGKLAAIARASEEATGNIILVSDANNHYSNGTLRSLVGPFADPEVGVVTGRKQIDDELGRPLHQAEGLLLALRVQAQGVGDRGRVRGGSGGRDSCLSPRGVSDPRAHDVDGGLRSRHGRRARGVATRLRSGCGFARTPFCDRRGRGWASFSDRGGQVAGDADDPAEAARSQAAAGDSGDLAQRLAPARAGDAGLRGGEQHPRRAVLWMARWLGLGQAVFYGMALLGWRNERLRKRNPWLFIPYYFCRLNLATFRGATTLLRGEEQTKWEKVDRGLTA